MLENVIELPVPIVSVDWLIKAMLWSYKYKRLLGLQFAKN